MNRKKMVKAAHVTTVSLDHIVNTVSTALLFMARMIVCYFNKIEFTPIDLNDCLPNPCRNNGMCLDGDGTFTCKCAPGWTGKFHSSFHQVFQFFQIFR